MICTTKDTKKEFLLYKGKIKYVLNKAPKFGKESA